MLLHCLLACIVFDNKSTVCFGIVFFICLVLGVHWSGISRLIIFIKLKFFSVIISSKNLSPPFFFCPLEILMYAYTYTCTYKYTCVLSWLKLSQRSLILCLHYESPFFSSCFILESFYCYSSALMVSSAMFHLLLIPSGVFFISVIVVFISWSSI